MNSEIAEPILISSFTHKGGVGKTTGLHNMAGLLSKELKLRVLLIDCDPQCSLTSVFLHDYFLKIGKQEIKKLKKDKKSKGEKMPKKTEAEMKQFGEEVFYERIKLASEPTGPELRSHSTTQDPPKKERTTVYECFKSDDLAYFADEENIRRIARDEVTLVHLEDYGELYVLPGDLLLNTLERDVAGGFAFGQIEALKRQQRIPGSISQMFREIARQKKMDVVLIDLSPAATFFNQSIVMCSDYFIISNLADYYSRRSITSIADVLKSWNKHVDFLRKIEPKFFRFPSCPKFLGHIFHRVRVSDGAATLDKQEKIDLIQQELKRKFLEEKVLEEPESIVIDNFHLYEPPIVKEFDRFHDQAVERGIPMPYINSKNIKLEDDATMSPKKVKNKNKAVEETRKFYMNSYFAAIAIIFRNLSDAHHLRLRNIFKPQETLEVIPLTNLDQTDFVGSYKGEQLNFQMRKVDDAYKVFVSESSHIPRTLEPLVKVSSEDVKKLFFQEMMDSYLPFGTRNTEVEDPRFDRIYQDLEEALKLKEERRKTAITELEVEDKHYDDLDELELLAKVHLNKNKTIQEYIGHCLQEKVHTAILNKHIHSKKGKRSYINNLQQEKIKMGSKGFRLCALAKNKNLRIWQIDDAPEIKLKEVQLAGENPNQDFNDILEVKRNVFRRLVQKKALSTKGPTESKSLNEKRLNPHDDDALLLEKKVKK